MSLKEYYSYKGMLSLSICLLGLSIYKQLAGENMFERNTILCSLYHIFKKSKTFTNVFCYKNCSGET